MIAIDVNDVSAWHQQVQAIQSRGECGSIRFKPPELLDGATVLHVWDPSGVLLVFIQ